VYLNFREQTWKMGCLERENVTHGCENPVFEDIFELARPEAEST